MVSVFQYAPPASCTVSYSSTVNPLWIDTTSGANLIGGTPGQVQAPAFSFANGVFSLLNNNAITGNQRAVTTGNVHLSADAKITVLISCTDKRGNTGSKTLVITVSKSGGL